MPEPFASFFRLERGKGILCRLTNFWSGSPSWRAGRFRFAALQSEAGRALLKSLNLDGFIAGQPSIFDSIRQLARSVPGSGVTA